MMSRSHLRLSGKVATADLCLLCTFKHSYAQVQRRYMAAARAPSTRHKQWQTKGKVVTPDHLAHKKRVADLEKLLAESTYLTHEQKLAIYSGNEQLALKLSDGVTYFIHEFRNTAKLETDFEAGMRRA